MWIPAPRPDQYPPEPPQAGPALRISWTYDTDGDGDTDGSDQTYRFAYDERWRVVAVYRGSDTSPKEQYVFHNAGAGGFGGSSYIDAVILRDKDANAGWTSASDGTLEQRYNYCQNWRADVVAIIKSDGTGILEWVKYLAYGTPSRGTTRTRVPARRWAGSTRTTS